MKHSVKGAWIALAIIIGLTASKFVLYAISGSIAVLSEAWHSFSDISTTLLVALSIMRQDHKERNHKEVIQTRTHYETEADTEADKIPGTLKRCYQWFHTINTELKVSLLIALILLTAASTILYSAITSDAIEVNLPLVTGIIFICLSFGSFFVYRFEESLGREEKSAALTADSQHNRADMVISLLTGISLILYYFGYNYDRWAGIAISVYIIAFACELLVNTMLSIKERSSEVIIKYRFASIVFRIFRADTYSSFSGLIDVKSAIGLQVEAGLKIIPHIAALTLRWTLCLGLAAAAMFYLSTMFYSVETDEEAILLRFGRVVNTDQAIQPGLHWKLPYPMDSVLKFRTKYVQALVVGNTLKFGRAMIWTKDHGDNLTFISGDNNLFLPFVVIHYRINQVHDYYLANASGAPRKILAAATYRLLNQQFTKTAFYDLLLNEREQWTNSIEQKIQEEMDRLRTGLEIIDFCLIDLHPPTDLAGFYEEVVAAGQLKETYLNNAERMVISNMANARMNAHKTVTEAGSYVLERTSNAQGEAANYLMRYKAYLAGGQIHKNLLSLQAAQNALKGKKIILVDPRSGIDEKLVYIENHMVGGKRR